jgi:hypothetical protein
MENPLSKSERWAGTRLPSMQSGDENCEHCREDRALRDLDIEGDTITTDVKKSV